MPARPVQIVALLLCAALLFGAFRLTPAINARRQAMNVAGYTQTSPTANTPPEYVFLIQALGAFRGLLTNILFIRATEMKEQGRYYDAMELASLICKLQPRFPSVWEFHSWNMAWNISVTTFTPQERWNWVYNGARLIRDEGLRYNPRAINLYKQLAWIFVNKMSETIDEHHMAYKREWAWRMHLLLGAPPDPLATRTASVDLPDLMLDPDDPFARALRKEEAARAQTGSPGAQTQPAPPPAHAAPTGRSGPSDAPSGETPGDVARKAAWLRMKAIADAPASLTELYAQTPDTRELVAQLRRLGVEISDEPLTEDEYWSERGLAMTFFQRYRKLSDPVAVMSQLRADARPDPDAAALEEFDRLVGVREQRPAGQALLRFLQRKVLREVYKLDPAHMAYLTEHFGPMDWRVVDAHSLYWVTQSIIQGGETVNEFGNDKTNTTRLLFFSLRNLYLRNKLVFEPNYNDIHSSYINLTPDLNFIEPMHQAYLKYGPWLTDERDKGPGAGETYRAGHSNFLTESIRLLYLAGREREAARYFEILRNLYGRDATGRVNEAFAKPLPEFVRESYIEGLGGPRETALAINAFLAQAYEALAQNNFVEYQRRAQLAMEIHRDYHATSPGISESKALPPFGQMQIDALLFYLQRPTLGHLDTVHNARLWRVLPLNLRRAVYDRMAERFKAECEAFGFDVARAFPEPPGMDEFRKALEQRGPKREEPTFETPIQPGG